MLLAETKRFRVILNGAMYAENIQCYGPRAAKDFGQRTMQLSVSGGIREAPNEFLDSNRHWMDVTQLYQ